MLPVWQSEAFVTPTIRIGPGSDEWAVSIEQEAGGWSVTLAGPGGVAAAGTARTLPAALGEAVAAAEAWAQAETNDSD